MDFGDFFPVGSPAFGRRPGFTYPDPPYGGPSEPTRLAAGLFALFGLPGIVLAVMGGRVMSGSSDDLLAPVIGVVGLAVLATGVLMALYAWFVAAALWRRSPGAWASAVVIASLLTGVGLLALVMFGPAGRWPLLLGLVVTVAGIAVLAALTRPACRADFPAPQRTVSLDT